MNNNIKNSTSSPNNSDSSEPRDHVIMASVGGIMPMNDHDLMTMCMDSSSSTSSSSMHANMVFTDQFDPFPLLSSSRYDIMMTGSAGYLDDNNNNNMAACLTQVGTMVDYDDHDVHGGYYGTLEPNKTGLESDFSLPPLEISRTSINVEDNTSTPIDDVKSHNNNNNHFKNSCCFNNTDDDHHHHNIQSSNNVVVEDMFGFANHGQGENFRMEDWDFEGLMTQDTSYFPSLD